MGRSENIPEARPAVPTPALRGAAADADGSSGSRPGHDRATSFDAPAVTTPGDQPTPPQVGDKPSPPSATRGEQATSRGPPRSSTRSTTTTSPPLLGDPSPPAYGDDEATDEPGEGDDNLFARVRGLVGGLLGDDD
jgi:hypothetical protein